MGPKSRNLASLPEGSVLSGRGSRELAKAHAKLCARVSLSLCVCVKNMFIMCIFINIYIYLFIHYLFIYACVRVRAPNLHHIYMCVYACKAKTKYIACDVPLVPHKAVAEASKIGNL